MLHACIKVQKPRFLSLRYMGGVGGNHVGNSGSIESPFLLYPASQLNQRFSDVFKGYIKVGHNCIGENHTIQVQTFRKHSYKTLKVEDWSCNNWQQLDNCFTISQYKTEKSKNTEISTPILLEVWLFWCETKMLSLYPKWLPSKLIMKSTGFKM